VEFRGLSKKGDREPVLEDAIDVIKNCGIAIENDDMRATFSRRFVR
jgi:hypothetical protein